MHYIFEYDEECTMVSPVLAKTIGLNETIIIQKLNDLIKQNKNDSKYLKEGSIWTNQPVATLCEKYFPYLSVSTIKRAISNLRKLNLIKVKKFNERKLENVNWYSIDYKAVENIILSEVDATDEDTLFIYVRGQNELIDEQLIKELEEMEL